MSAKNCEQIVRTILDRIGGPNFEQFLMRIVETMVPRDGRGPPTNSDEFTLQSVICFLMCPRKMMSWADSYVSLCECACCGLKRIPIQPRIEQNIFMFAAAERDDTHSQNLPHRNLQQGSKCSASFRWGVGLGYRLKSAPFLRDDIRHDQLYATVARPVTCLRGAAPRMSSPSHQPANILHPAFWLVAGEDAVRPRVTTGNNHAGALACTRSR